MRSYLLLIFLAINTIASSAIAEPSKKLKFFSVADIHFDPFYACSKTLTACPSLDKLQAADFKEWSHIFEQTHTKESAYKDANYFVFANTLEKMHTMNQTEKAAFVIILGDFLSHDFHEDFLLHSKKKTHAAYENFVKKTFQFIQYEFAKKFPETSIYPVIGNNDSYHGDYAVIAQGNFFKDLVSIWSSSILEKENRASFASTFPYAGYYEIKIPEDASKKIIVLNSVAFSTNARGNHINQIARTELEWLRQRLLLAEKNHEKIIIADHIPVGIDVYATFQNKLNALAQFWKLKYTKAFEELLEKYRVVSVMLSGHIHIDSIQAITLKQFAGVPVNITPSVSPIFGNDPAFKVISLDPVTLTIDETETINTPLVRSKVREKTANHMMNHRRAERYASA